MIEALLYKAGPLTMESNGGHGTILRVDVQLVISDPTQAQCQALLEAGWISATLHLEVPK